MKKQLWNDGWYFRSVMSWETPERVTLPHDAMQADGRAPDALSGDGGAYYLGRRYVYTKSFEMSREEAKGEVLLHFDGVMRDAKVFVNGVQAGSNAYGYLPFFIKLTGLVQEGENDLRVEADNSAQPASRWYSGGGIYRAAELWTGAKAHIEPEGIRVRTVGIEPLEIEVSVVHGPGEVSVQILDGEAVLARGQGDRLRVLLPGAQLWSDETPKLYRCRAVLSENGIPVDEAEQEFGIRLLSYDATGFYVNGKRTLLRGGCLHHDNGILGACSVPEAEERRLKILKSAGFNAIRSAHNPASTALLRACDRLGVYVMEELWDMWYQRKNKYDYGKNFPQHWRGDVKAVVSRDYTHPSVILYSIGNENTEPFEQRGVEQGKEIVALLHELDDSRPVTMGLNMALLAMSAMGMGLYDHVDEKKEKEAPAVNSTVFNELASRSDNLLRATVRPEVNALATPMMNELDIVGYNYAAPRYPLDASEHPGQVSVGSETYAHQLAATWKLMESCPYVIGDFMWTAWDYIGECGIGAWSAEADALEFKKPYPWKLAEGGAFDLLGDPTGEALWAAAVWKGETHMAVRPVNHPWQEMARGGWRGTNAISSWSWRGCEGKTATVEVYTPGVRVELILNGKPAGSSKTEELRAMFEIPYQPGRLEAVAWDEAGNVCGRSVLESAAGELRWEIRCETPQPHTGETAFFAVTLLGENGVQESNADEELRLKVTGGELLGFGSAAPRTEREFTDGVYPSRYGKALAAVRPGGGETLTITLDCGERRIQESFSLK